LAPGIPAGWFFAVLLALGGHVFASAGLYRVDC
jgi:hypothetical protein